MKQIATLFLLAVALVLGGCATDLVRGKMSYHVEPGVESRRMLWPSAPDIPRYAYAGELMGEPNFHPETFSGRKTGEALAAFLLGVDEVSRNPFVLARPQSGTVDAKGRIFVTDVGRSSVFVFDEKEGALDIWTEAGSGIPFSSPVGIVQGPNDEMWVADANLGLIVRLSDKGEPLGFVGAGVLSRPTGIVRDPVKGMVYVADTRANQVKMFNDHGELLGVIEGDAPVDANNRDPSFNTPTHLSFAGGKLYVTDTFNARIQIFDGEGHFLRSFGQRGINLGDLVRPKGVAVDDEGNIYVVESYHDRLIVYNAAGELLLVIGGLGVEIGQFYLPSGVWVDKRNRVYVADMFNGRVMIFQYLGGE